MTKSTTEAGGKGRWTVMKMIKNGSIVGTSNDGGGLEASGARREQVATRRLYKEQRAMSKEERLAIESVTNWKNFGRRLIEREVEVDQDEDFPKPPPQYTLSSRMRKVSTNFYFYLFEYRPQHCLSYRLVRLFTRTRAELRPTKASCRFKPVEKYAVSCPVPTSLIMILEVQMRAVLAYQEDLPTDVASMSTPSSPHTFRLHSARRTLH
jgi:hypothetical protein